MRSRHPALGHLLVCAAYLPLTLWATWPLAAHPGTQALDSSRHQSFAPVGLADQQFVLWALAWGTRALMTDPTSLFDGNLFHPARFAFARSDHFLGNLPLFAPVYAATGNPLLAHNLTWLASFPLSAAAMYALAWHCTQRMGAAFVAGALLAFTPHRLISGHLQMQSAMYLPLCLLAGMRLLGGGAWRAAGALAACLVLQSLCSVYLGALAFTLSGTALVAYALAGRMARGALWRYLAAMTGALAILVPLHLPYLALVGHGSLPPASYATLELISARPIASYLRRPGDAAMAQLLSRPAALLGMLGIFAARRGALPARALLLAVGLLGYVLSLGPTLRLGSFAIPLPYRLLVALPGFATLRGAARFGLLVAIATSALAALGLAPLLARIRPRARGALAGALVLVLAWELSDAPVAVRPLETGPAVPAVYHWLADHEPHAPVLELPVGTTNADFHGFHAQARYTYMSTYHWHPILNGYSGYPPASFFLLMTLARHLPDAGALQDLVDASGVRWLIVHRRSLPRPERGRWADGVELPGLEPVLALGDDVVYRVTLPARRDLTAALQDERVRPTTLSGLARAPLPEDGLRAALARLTVPRNVVAGAPVRARITVENRSPHPWPGLDPFAQGLVGLQQEWFTFPGDTRTFERVTPLARDVGPGERTEIPFTLEAPGVPGPYLLRVSLGQDGRPSFDRAPDAVAERVVTVRPWLQATSRRRAP